MSAFDDVLMEMQRLHLKKSHDYGTKVDPFANVRAAEKFGLSPALGAALRIQDKVNRAAAFFSKGRLENESLRDSFIDIAVYSVIAIVLLEEEQKRLTDAANQSG